jgi:hypothetical protein
MKLQVTEPRRVPASNIKNPLDQALDRVAV